MLLKEFLRLTQTLSAPICAAGTTALIVAGGWAVSRGRTEVVGAARGAMKEFKKNSITVTAWLYRRARYVAFLCVFFVAYRMRRRVTQLSWLYAIYLNRSVSHLLQET